MQFYASQYSSAGGKYQKLINQHLEWN